MLEEWAGLFPLNDVLEMVFVNVDKINCQACLRESEEEDATEYCLVCLEYLCKMCIKYHKRGLTTQNHKLIPLTELKTTSIVPNAVRENTCLNHQGRKIELFCNDHEEPCCTMCVSMEHRECGSVDTVEKTAQNLRECLKENNDIILEDMQILKNKLADAKNEQEMLVLKLHDRSASFSESAEQEFNAAIHHLEYLKNEHLTNMSKVVKKTKEKYDKCMKSFVDGIQCADFCTENLEEAKNEDDDAESVIKYYRGKKITARLKNFKFSQIHIEIEEEKPYILEEIMDLKSLQEANVTESVIDIMTDLRRVQLKIISEFRIDVGCVRDGAFLGNGQFILSTRKPQRSSYDDKCFVYDKYWECKSIIGSLSQPFGLAQKDKELFVGCTLSKCITVLSLTFLNKVKTIRIGREIFGIAYVPGYFYLACDNKIIKIYENGRHIKEYNTGFGVKYIISSGRNIVYSNTNTNEVTAWNNMDLTIWTYNSPFLISPCGLDRDTDGNIYVAGKQSDNIHVLSSDGQLIRLFEDIPRPDFMKINQDRNICCVCSNRRNIRVYEFK
ncbi:uncharacterized protein LOC133198245 [Saccostrea echinata]|uniref:uncharacterized protein LOC133198245 n=1 Tax=Saccostrea echinata TaxID=191078 RepID=UPI002A819D3F|nr:uncharacterized protein LOC133198245 [Saccostrea echinata]